MSKYDFSNLKLLFPLLPWQELWIHFHPQRSNRGLKPTFTWEMLVKLMFVQFQVQIKEDNHFADFLKGRPDLVELCGMPRAPSHDVISKFTSKHGEKLHILHKWLDKMLEEHGVFEGDDLSGDGTILPIHQPYSKADKDCFGASSSNKKFYGFWLMLIVSVSTGLTRAFSWDKARIGQIKLMFDLLTSGIIKPGCKIFLDGIFDIKDIHAAIIFDQECLPMITYNPKNSKCKTRKQLSEDDWRGRYNEYFRDIWMIFESSKRSSVERTNGNSKMNTILSQFYERSRRLSKKSGNHLTKIIIGSLIMPQINKLADIYRPKPITLFNFIEQDCGQLAYA